METVELSQQTMGGRYLIWEQLEERIVLDGAVDDFSHQDQVDTHQEDTHRDSCITTIDLATAAGEVASLGFDMGVDYLPDGTWHYWEQDGNVGSGGNGYRFDAWQDGSKSFHQIQWDAALNSQGTHNGFDYNLHRDGSWTYESTDWQANGNGSNYRANSQGFSDYTGVDLDSPYDGWEYSADSSGAWVYHGYHWSNGFGWEYASNSLNEWYYETVYVGQNSQGVNDGTGHWTGNYTGFQDFMYDFHDPLTPNYYYSPMGGTDWSSSCWTHYWAKDYSTGNWSAIPAVLDFPDIARIIELPDSSGAGVYTNGLLYFGVDGDLWRSDGTASGTYMAKDFAEYSSGLGHMTAVNGELFFTKDDGIHGGELWKSDGTTAGTILLKDISDGNYLSGVPDYLTNVNGVLFYNGWDSHGEELWKSDGTSAGTQMVRDINPNPDNYNSNAGSDPRFLTEMGGNVYFAASDGINGRELWRSDGTLNGTLMVRDIWPGNWNWTHDWAAHDGFTGSQLVNVNGTLFLVGQDSESVLSLWKSDGTTPGTIMVKAFPVSDPSLKLITDLTNVNGTLYFNAADDANGYALWKSDGTTAGTVMVKDILPLSTYGSGFYEMTNVNGTLFFVTSDGVHGQELWKSDGTAEGTVMVKDIYTGTLSVFPPRDLTNVNGTLFFVATQDGVVYKLWRSDGTTAGTSVFRSESISNPDILAVDGSTLYFTAYNYGASNEAGLYRYTI